MYCAIYVHSGAIQVSTEDGMIHCIDRTQPDSKLFTLNAHDSSLSGMLCMFIKRCGVQSVTKLFHTHPGI